MKGRAGGASGCRSHKYGRVGGGRIRGEKQGRRRGEKRHYGGGDDDDDGDNNDGMIARVTEQKRKVMNPGKQRQSMGGVPHRGGRQG